MSYRSSKKLISFTVTIIIILLALLGYIRFDAKSTQPAPTPPTQKIASHSAEIGKVSRAIDGDTIKLEDGRTVRYIGIDTPELHHPQKSVQCFAQQAADENKRLVEGKAVRMVRDVSDTDRYGRLLRYVYVQNPVSSSSAIFVNEYLVEEGFAYAAFFPPDIIYSEQFQMKQNEAAVTKKGLWSSCPLR